MRASSWSPPGSASARSPSSKSATERRQRTRLQAQRFHAREVAALAADFDAADRGQQSANAARVGRLADAASQIAGQAQRRSARRHDGCFAAAGAAGPPIRDSRDCSSGHKPGCRSRAGSSIAARWSCPAPPLRPAANAAPAGCRCSPTHRRTAGRRCVDCVPATWKHSLMVTGTPANGPSASPRRGAGRSPQPSRRARS